MSDEPTSVTQGASQTSLIWTSLGDSELIEFVNELSQRRQGEDMNHKSQIIEDELDLTQPDQIEVDWKEERGDILPNGLSSFTLAQKPIEEEENGSEEEEEDEEELAFGDHARYFANKHKMQQKADEEYVDWLAQKNGGSVKQPQIFEGCVVYVNGRTNPDIEQLHKMVIVHGGVFLAFLGAKGNATHIIASNLTPRKKIEFRNYKVVRPEWITESIKQGRRLPWSDFQLISNDYGQRMIGFARREEPPKLDEKSKLDEAPKVDESLKEKTVLQDEAPKVGEAQNKPQMLKEAKEEPEVALTAKDPGFLQQFFARSRLHHLSTWKADLRAEYLERALQESKQRPRNAKFRQSVIMHIDFDCFFVAASALKQLKDPEVFRTMPVCVTHGGANADVASCNYIARKMGARNGMWFHRAQKCCGGKLISLNYDFDEYERISKLFYECLLEIKPFSLLPVSVDEALLDISNIAEKEDLSTFVATLRRKIYDTTKCTVTAGCGPNVLLAKLALRKAKPDGQFSVVDYDEPAILRFLSGIDVRDLPGVGYNVQHKLAEEFKSSRFTVANLRNVDVQRLINMFGVKTGVTLSEYARGIDNTSIDIAANPEEFTRKSISIDVNWGIRFDTMTQVETFLVECCKVLNERLLKARKVGSQLTMKLARRAENAPVEPPKHMGMGLCDFVSKSSRLGIATREVGILSSEARNLCRILNVPATELRGIALQLTRLVADDIMERDTRNQMRLPFQKVAELPVEKAETRRDSAPAPAPMAYREPPKKPVTQADIKKSLESFMTRPKQTSYEVSESQINWDVFQDLPPDIQTELRSEFERRGLVNKPTPASTPRKRKKSPKKTPQKQQKLPESLVSLPSSRGGSPFAVSSTPKKPQWDISKKLKLNDTTIDMDVFQELPSSIRNGIIEQAEAEKDMRTTETAVIRMKDRLIEFSEEKMAGYLESLNIPTLQRQVKFSKVKDLLKAWIQDGLGDVESSLTASFGPLEADTRVFTGYLTDLLWDHNDVTRVMSLVEYMRICLQDKQKWFGYAEWDELVVRLEQMVAAYASSHGSSIKYTF